MTRAFQPDNDPVNSRNIPPLLVRGARLERWLLPAYRAVPFPRTNMTIASFLSAAVAGLLLSIGGWPTSFGGGLITAGLTTLPLAIALGVYLWRRSEPPEVIPPPSLASVFGGWDSLTEAIRTSQHEVQVHGETVRERDHLFVGILTGFSKLFLLNSVYLSRPAIIVGRTGSGKTKLIAESLLIQTIRRKDRHIVVIDLKGDKAFFYGLAIAAAEARLNFKWLTIEPGKSSYLWNPHSDPAVSLLSREQFIQIYLRALCLVTGQEHGAGYFGAQSEERTRRSFEQEWPSSSRAFYQMLRQQRAADVGMSERDFSNSGHLVANLARIASIAVLNAVPGDPVPELALQGAITLRDILSQPGVTYFNLSAQLEPTSALFTAKLLIHLICAVAKVYQGPRVPVLIWADEFQEMISADLATPIRQARESQIAIWAGFQDLSALKTAAGDFAPVLLGNAPLKIFCTAEDPAGREYLMESSGETTRLRRAVTETVTTTATGATRGTAVQHREENVPRIDAETINHVNRDSQAFIAIASESRGFTQFRFPLVARATFHISRLELDRREALPWPRGNRYTLTVEPTHPDTQPEPSRREPSGREPSRQEPGPVADASPAGASRREGSPPENEEVQAAPPEPTLPERTPPEPTQPRRRSRSRKERPEGEPQQPLTGAFPAGVEGESEMADYLRKLAGEVTPSRREPSRQEPSRQEPEASGEGGCG